MKKVLVVDDEPDILDLTRMFLENEGYKVFTAGNSEEALKIVENMIPDIILLDIVMSGFDGLETCEILKSNPITGDIPVIMFSALGREEDKAKSREAGACDYIIKPFSKETLLKKIKAHLG
ncbi:response regulator [Candidatus Bathyarchaeota archaeon]|nr:response regulator [Candidatus Bathyarchaeota archaeon]